MKTIILLLLSYITVSAQVVSYGYYNANPPEIGIASYHRSGFTTLGLSSAADISDANPASIALFNKMFAGLSFEYNSEINISNVIAVHQSRSNPLLPATFGFVYPVNNFVIALAYHQKYNTYQEYDPIQLSTFENPDGTGEYFKPVSDRVVHSPSLMGSYTFGDSRLNNNTISLGIQLFYNYAVFNDKVINTQLLFEEGNFNWKIGLSYNYKEDIAIGIMYENKFEINGVAEYDSEFKIERFDPGEDNSGNIYRLEAADIKMKFKLPGKIAVGLSAKTLNTLRLSFAFSTIDWSAVHSSYKTQINLSSNAVYSFSETTKFSMGFFNSAFYYLNDENYYGRRISWNRTFVSAGSEIKFDKFTIQLELMDNHLFAVEKLYQTLAKVGLNYTFE